MRFSIRPRVFSPCEPAQNCYTNKPADKLPSGDGSSATTDDESSTSSNTSTNGNNSNSNSNNKHTPKSLPRKKYPLLCSTSSPSTGPSKALLPIRIQFALSMFIKRSTTQNWNVLVNLLREETLQCPSVSSSSSSWPHHDDEGMKRTLARLEKSLADELTVYEVEDDEDELTVYEAENDDEEEEDVGKEREEMLDVGGESVMELLLAPPKVPKLVNSSAPTKIKMKSRVGSQNLMDEEAELDIPGSVANTFIQRPSTGNWELLVQLFRNENGRRFANDKNAPHEILSVDSDLTFDESVEAAMGDKALSIIYESDEESDHDDDGAKDKESIVGIGLFPETGMADHYESDESERKVHEEQKEEHDQEWIVNPATEEKWSDALPFAGQLDWPPCPDERETMVVAKSATTTGAVPSQAPNIAPRPTIKVPPSFSNTRAKAYVILWERRIRKFDQNQVNVVQKSRQGVSSVNCEREVNAML